MSEKKPKPDGNIQVRKWIFGNGILGKDETIPPSLIALFKQLDVQVMSVVPAHKGGSDMLNISCNEETMKGLVLLLKAKVHK